MMARKLAALVIGNAAYVSGGTLMNPSNDANDIATKLERFEFSVIRRTNCTFKDMDFVLKGFKASLSTSDVGLFFFAGHGMQIDGENYLAATDTDFTDEIDAKHSSLALNRIIETMEKSPTATNIIVLDACRENPFERAWHRSAATRGLASVYAPKGTLIAFATSPGQVASDGAGRNGAYTESLLKHIEAEDCSIEMMFKRVRNTLSAATKQKQISWEHTSLSGEFYFNLSVGARIDTYSVTAVSDGLYALDPAESAHRMIRDLKSYTWPTQNPAVDTFGAAQANAYSDDALFVIGRNLYQAACGSARSAATYLTNFASKTQGMQPGKRKALLDGVLFEVFFDPKSKLRRKPKEWMSGDVFTLRQMPDLAASFDFITECLSPYAHRFHALPGRGHEVPVHVTTKALSAGKGNLVEGVHLGGANIYWAEPDSWSPFVPEDTEAGHSHSQSLEEFERQLAKDMVVPKHLLKVTYDFDRHAVRTMLVPAGWTARKKVDQDVAPA
jgi:hypothetical protein